MVCRLHDVSLGMRSFKLLCLSTLFACAVEHETPDTTDPAQPGGGGGGSSEEVDTQAVPDVRCAGTPDVGQALGWRHTLSAYTVELGSPHHRGIDLIATTEEATQLLTGKITYGPTDKDLEDEDVELFACLDASWTVIGATRTNSDGKFSLALTGDERLPAGMRDLYVSVTGDRTGASFIGFVAPPNAWLVVSDVDGTLTASENEYPESLVLGGDVAAQPGAAAALMSLAQRDYTIVYVTARGDRFSLVTRDWFAAKGFPRGPTRMPTSIVTMPGEDTVEFKRTTIQSLSGFDVKAGVGNRASDITAYMEAGLAADRIFIKLPEFTTEIGAAIASATGFELYEQLAAQQLAAM
jgi:phosphatidate phosphatase PAH1